MGRDFVEFPPFFMQPNPRSLPQLVVVVHGHRHDGGDSYKGVNHGGDQRTVPETDHGGAVDTFQQLPSFLRQKYRGFSALYDVLRATHCSGRIEGDNLPGDQPVKAHADGSQVLFDGRSRIDRGEVFDVSGHENWLNLVERSPPVFTPSKEIDQRTPVGAAGIAIADLSGKELDEAAHRLGASGLNNVRDMVVEGSTGKHLLAGGGINPHCALGDCDA